MQYLQCDVLIIKQIENGLQKIMYSL